MYVYILYQDQRVTDLVRITALDYEGRNKDVQVADKGPNIHKHKTNTYERFPNYFFFIFKPLHSLDKTEDQWRGINHLKRGMKLNNELLFSFFDSMDVGVKLLFFDSMDTKIRSSVDIVFFWQS